jgi:hypothetical protein
MRKIHLGYDDEIIAELPTITSVVASPLTLEFALWLQQPEVFDMFVKELNDEKETEKESTY